MQPRMPHFLLVSGLINEANQAHRSQSGWHFTLEPVGGGEVLEASHFEPGSPARLELLAVVRGLEALDQPSRVTLLTSSRSITRGMRFGLSEWKENAWSWERLGRQEPIKHADLWKRVDGALKFHDVRCRTWRIDDAHGAPTRMTTKAASSSRPAQLGPNRIKKWIGRSAARCASILDNFATRTAT